jgi:2-isopropylmalate synthase
MELIPLSIFDTTLRDGEQAPGNAMTVLQKIEIATELEALGVNVIETGFPMASTNDFETTLKLSQIIRKSKLCAFARASRTDIQVAFDAIKQALNFQIEIVTTVSNIHLEHKRGISRREALDEAREAVRFAVSLGVSDISVGPEDATRADRDFLHEMVDSVVNAGAGTIVVPDTVGACVPAEFADLIASVRSWVGVGIRISAHTHNDLGLATANTLAAIEAGAEECQVTLCGIGERAGNAALEEVVAVVESKPSLFRRKTTIDTKRIQNSCTLLMRLLQVPISRSKPVIGTNAFTTAAGIHQSGMLRNPKTYEFLDPERFGAKRQLILARHSGRNALRAKFESMGIPIDKQTLESVYQCMLLAEHLAVFSDEDLLDMLESANQKKVGGNAEPLYQ